MGSDTNLIWPDADRVCGKVGTNQGQGKKAKRRGTKRGGDTYRGGIIHFMGGGCLARAAATAAAGCCTAGF